MKKLGLTLLLFILLFDVFAQMINNKNYIVFQGGPHLKMNSIPEWICIGDCVDGRQCRGYGYEGPGVTIEFDQLVCDFVGAKTVQVNAMADVYIDHSDGSGCNLNYSVSNFWHSFSVTGVDFNWIGMPSAICPSSPPVNLISYFSDSNGTIFNGPGVSGTVFNPSVLGPGTYSITATKAYDNGMASRTITVKVPQKGEIIIPTYDVCSGGSVSMGASSGDGTSNGYQWQESSNGGATWGTLSNTGIYSGVNSLTLRLTSVAPWMNGYRYRLIMRYSCGDEFAEGVTTLNVIATPTIVVDPLPITVCEGGAASFMATASGEVNYQWQYSGSGGAGSFVDIPGATSSIFSIANSQLNQDGFYRSVISNPCSESGFASQAARLTVRPATRISLSPADRSVCPMGSAVFDATASGTGVITYEWEQSIDFGATFSTLINVPGYLGASTGSLTITGVVASMNDNRFRVVVRGQCGPAVVSASGRLTVQSIPSLPTVTNPSRCGDGPLTATASSQASSPTYQWYANSGDVTPVFKGASYVVNNLTLTTSYFVSVSSQGCESPRQRVLYTRHAPQQVSMGSALSLCQGQGPYNLEKDIADPVARGSNFSWTANGTNYTSKIFDPSIGKGNYLLTYDPPSSSKAVPHCYVPSTRTINVVASGGDGGIVFSHALLSNGNTMNLCVGDSPIDIASFPSVQNGAWQLVSGSGLSYSGSAVVFTPGRNSYTEVLPNVFRYTVQVNGCTASKDLEVYVKDNPHVPVVTGLSGVVCPGKILGLAASVSAPGNFSYEWYESGNATPIFSGNSLTYTVGDPVTLQVRSINAPFGCLSEATLIPIATPFSSGSINVSRSVIPSGEYVDFNTDATEAGNSFHWSFGDGATSNEKDPTHYFYQLGDFIVTLSIQSSLGCSQQVSYDKITVWGDSSQGPITGEEKEINTWFAVYPNPVSDLIHIESKRPILSCELVDLTGRHVGIRIKQEDQGLSMNTADLKAGVYLLRLQTLAGHKEIKVIKRE